MNKKQLKKIRRAKLLKKKHNKAKIHLNKVFSSDIVKVMKVDFATGEKTFETMTRKEADILFLEQERKGREVYNNVPGHMIHEDDFIPHDCYLCGSEITSVHDTHNPFPLIDFNSMQVEENGKKEPKRCCSKCETSIVMPARMESMRNGTFREVWEERNFDFLNKECA